MTAKQKAARAKFKAVVAEAKKLRKKNPKLTQAQAVKQAWAISYSKEGKAKKVGYSKDRTSILKKATPYIKKYKKKGYSKQDAIRNANIDAAYMSGVKKSKSTKVKARKKKSSSEMHTDTKSHNVNIRVVSGLGSISNQALSQIKDANDKMIKWQKILMQLEIEKKKVTKGLKPVVNRDIKLVKSAIQEQKKHISELKKHIK